MRIPAAKRKVDAELGKVRADIRLKLIPQGPKVIRHLALPPQGKSKDWIVEEMKRMDDESPESHSWRNGKVSGTVYRSCCGSLAFLNYSSS
jgi:sphinganine-1-phosphate aldolase